MNENLSDSVTEEFLSIPKSLSKEEIMKLEVQNTRLVPEAKANKLELDAKRNWDLFYKRNETRFFKDRRWTTREFKELLLLSSQNNTERKIMLEVGCGVGNLIFPLIEDQCNNFFVFACDFSPRAIDFVKKNPFYDEKKIKAFHCDITTLDIVNHIAKESLDIITLIFVLSAIHPDKHKIVLNNLYSLLKPGGVILFRDYGLYDMAQIRFKPGNKISNNFYMRQDGTRSYYFSEDELSNLFLESKYKVLENSYIYRRTINPKEKIDVGRIFIQGKFVK